MVLLLSGFFVVLLFGFFVVLLFGLAAIGEQRVAQEVNIKHQNEPPCLSFALPNSSSRDLSNSNASTALPPLHMSRTITIDRLSPAPHEPHHLPSPLSPVTLTWSMNTVWSPFCEQLGLG